MNLEKWDNIITDWVNCLKLGDQIYKVEDLRSGVFFINFLKFLTLDASYNKRNIVQAVTNFLKDRYLNIDFVCKSNQLEALEHENFVIVCSLLMHYSSLCDGRACFTFPLCHHLSRETQLCIRTFLNSVTTRSTIDEIFGAIINAVNKSIKPKYIYTNSLSNDVIGSSPLQELLNVSSTQLANLENLDKVLNVLEVDIQSQEKIFEDQEENSMDVVCEEVKLQFEEEIDLSFTLNYDHRNTLQRQMQELEKICETFGEEQSVLEKEKDVLQKRIEEIETSNYENIKLLKTELQDKEIDKVYLAFIELRSLVDAVQETKSKADPIAAMLNYSDGDQSLKEVFNCCLEAVSSYKKGIEVSYTEISKLEDNCAFLTTINEDYSKLVLKLSDSQQEIGCDRVKLETFALEICDFLRHTSSSSTINKLEEQINVSKNKIEDLLCQFQEVLQEPVKMACEINDKDKVNYINDDIVPIESRYNTLLSNYNEKSFFLSSITINFNHVENKLEKRIAKLEQLFSNSNDLHWTNLLNVENDSRDAIVTFQELIVQLKLTVAMFSEKNMISLKEYEVLNSILKYAIEQMFVLEEIILTHAQNITVLECNIFEATSAINELEALKDTVLLENSKDSLNLKLFQYLDKLEKDKVLLEDLDKSIATLEEIKTDIDDKVVTLAKTLNENAIYQSEILELQALGSVFEEEIFKKMEESVLYKETIDELQTNVDVLRQQLAQINECCQKNICTNTKIVSETFQDDIETINTEIAYYQANVNELELDLQILKIGATKAEQDLTMVVDVKKELQDITDNIRFSFDTRFFILKNADKDIERKLALFKNDDIKLNSEIEEKWAVYNNFTIQKEHEVCEYRQTEREIEELTEQIFQQEESSEVRYDLLSTVCHDILPLKLKLQEKKEYLYNLETKVSEINRHILCLGRELSVLQNQSFDVKEKSKTLKSKTLILTNLKQTLEKQYSFGIELHLSELASDLSQKQNQLEDIIKDYKEEQEDVEAKMTYFKSALFENITEYQNLIKNLNIAVNYSMDKISHTYDNICELTNQIQIRDEETKACVKVLRLNVTDLHDQIKSYICSLETNYEANVKHGVQLNSLEENLDQVLKRNKTLDAEHEKTINKLELTQSRVESLECQKLEFETQLLKQNFYFEEEYEKNVTHLNKKIKELVKKEFELKAKLAKNMNDLQESNWANNNLYSEFNLMCTEFTNLKDDKAYVGKKLESFNFSCQELKDDFDSFSSCHLETLEENCKKLVQLQIALSKHIEMLMSENDNLKASILHLQNYVVVLQTEQKLTQKNYLEKLQKMDIEKIMLENKNKINTQNANVLRKEKELVEKNILGWKKYKTDDEFVFFAMAFARDIFETGQHILETNVEDNLKQIKLFKEDMVHDQNLFKEKLESKEAEIKDISTKIKLLQIELGENSNKNNKLLLELCTVNASLSSFSRQHATLKQALSKQEEENEKAKPVKINKEVFIQNIQSQNHALFENVVLAKEEIEELKEKLKSCFLERQALDFKSQVINEKIAHHRHYLDEDKKLIFDNIRQSLEKLDDIFRLQNCKAVLQNKLKILSVTLKEIIIQRSCVIKNRIDIFKDTETAIYKIHRNTAEIYSCLLRHIIYLDKDRIMSDNLKNNIDKLIDGEEVAKEIMGIQMLEMRNEKYILSQKHSSLSHYLSSLLCIFKEIPIGFFLNEDITLLNVSDTKALSNSIEDVEQQLILSLKAKTNSKNIANKTILEETYIYNTLNSIKIERSQTNNSFDCLQKAYNRLTKKRKELEVSQNAKDAYAVVQNIINIEKRANVLYNFYKKFDGYPIKYLIVLDKLIFERNYLENSLQVASNNLKFLETHLSGNTNCEFFEQLHSFETMFFDVYYQFVYISGMLYGVMQTVIKVPFDCNRSSNTSELMEEISSETAFKQIKHCCKRVSKLLEQVLLFKKNYILNLVYSTEESVNLSKIYTNYKKNSNDAVKRFEEKLRIFQQRCTLLKEELCRYFTINCIKNRRVSDRNVTGEIVSDDDVKCLCFNNKKINDDEYTEEILQTKKAKLKACSMDLEQIKQHNFLEDCATLNKDTLKPNNFIVQKTREKKSVGTSSADISQRVNFGQQYPNRQKISSSKTQIEKVKIFKKQGTGFTIKHKKENVTRLKNLDNCIKTTPHTNSTNDYGFLAFNIEDCIVSKPVISCNMHNCQDKLLYSKFNKENLNCIHDACCLEKDGIEYQNLRSITSKIFLFFVILIIMIFVNIHMY